MFPIPKKKFFNGNNIRLNTDNSINNFRFRKKLDENRNKLNKYKRLLHNLRFNIIKEQAMLYKKNVQDNLGPGTYSPKNISDLKKNNQMAKTLVINEERIPSYIDMNDNPGVGEYNVNGEFKQNVEKNLTLLKSKQDKEKYDQKIVLENFKKKWKNKQQRRFIRIDYTETDEYKIRKQYMHNSLFRPPFNSAVPKFNQEKKDDANIDIYTNEQDIIDYPPKKINNHLNIPFLSKAVRSCNQTIDANSEKKIGPGSYEQKSFFDWNKKSFNVQYKLK